jgi:acetyltransferase-like isoleucine patch superfamily enzyme
VTVVPGVLIDGVIVGAGAVVRRQRARPRVAIDTGEADQAMALLKQVNRI